MRSEEQMMNLILDFVKDNAHIKAIFLNGSRVNPNIDKDVFQDYDIVFVVDSVDYFKINISWLNHFGNILMLQDPNKNSDELGFKNQDIHTRYNWLVLYDDFNRLDITIMTEELAIKEVSADSLTVILLDKYNILPAVPNPSDKDYHITKPTESQYNSCVNNFWWCMQNVAKGLARNQIPYAMKMYNNIVREMMDRMINWHIAYNNNFEVSAGMWGKYYKDLLNTGLYSQYLNTYSGSDIKNIWESVDVACKLFSKVSKGIAGNFGFTYNTSEEEGIIKYFDFVKSTFNH